MQGPAVRFTVGRLMVIVALIALLLGIGIGALRSRKVHDYRKQADRHARAANYWRWQAGRIPELYPDQDEAGIHRDLQKVIRWHLQMEDYYRRATARPWTPVTPHPPRP
ncbi:hypothetical protein BH23PLA1_BH23PLA1_09940 [soil metagenome]